MAADVRSGREDAPGTATTDRVRAALHRKRTMHPFGDPTPAAGASRRERRFPDAVGGMATEMRRWGVARAAASVVTSERGHVGYRVRVIIMIVTGLLTSLATSWAPPAESASQREPTRSASRKGASQHSERVLVDLSRKDTYVLLPVHADHEDVRITDIHVLNLPAEHRLVPASGTARRGEPVDIQLEHPPQVRIRMAVVRRGLDLALRISPQIVLGSGEIIDLSQDRITRAGRSLRRRVNDLNHRLVALARERDTLHLWLSSPANKPLSDVKAARARLKVLDHEIQAHQSLVPLVHHQCEAVRQVAEFIREVHGAAEIRYRVSMAAQADRG